MEDKAMKLVKTNYANPVVDSLFNELFNWTDSYPRRYESTKPLVNIKENEKDYSIQLAVPGIKKEDVKVEIEKNVLTVYAETKKESKSEEDGYIKKEFDYQSFSQSFNLPVDEIDENQINAQCDNGVLSISIPKNTKNIEKRQIAIS